MSDNLTAEAQAALEAGDLEALEGLSEAPTVKTRPSLKLKEEGEETRKPKHRPTRRREEIFEPPLDITQSKGGSDTMVKQNQDTGKQPTPFGVALKKAREIDSREADENDLKELRKAVDQLSEDDRRNLVFRLAKEVLEENTPISGLFPVARQARMLAVAYNVATIRKIVLQAGVTFSNLEEVGLAEIKVNPNTQKPYTVYHLGHETLVEAARKFREIQNSAAAQIIEEHLRRGERERRLAQVAKEARVTTAQAQTQTNPEKPDEKPAKKAGKKGTKPSAKS